MCLTRCDLIINLLRNIVLILECFSISYSRLILVVAVLDGVFYHTHYPEHVDVLACDWELNEVADTFHSVLYLRALVMLKCGLDLIDAFIQTCEVTLHVFIDCGGTLTYVLIDEECLPPVLVILIEGIS